MLVSLNIIKLKSHMNSVRVKKVTYRETMHAKQILYRTLRTGVLGGMQTI